MTVDLTRRPDFNEKKTLSIQAVPIKYTDISDATAHKLFTLPPNCLVTQAYVLTKTPGQALLTADLGFTEVNGNDLGDDLDVNGPAGKVDANMSTFYMGVDTGTGRTVAITFSAKPTAGEWVVVVQFVEYTLGNGQLTNYAAQA